jgi:hypothetical protein
MPRHYIETGLCLYGSLVEPHQMQIDYTLAGSPHVARSTSDATFD